MRDEQLLQDICTLPYSNRGRLYRREPPDDEGGPRRRYLHDRLEPHEPVGDDVGNLWVEQDGDSGYTVVVSSHMDTVFGKHASRYELETEEDGDGTEVSGCLDNGVGCYMNLKAVDEVDSPHTVYHAFTVNEEYGMTGADRFTDWLDELDGDPDLFIVLDATYGDIGDRRDESTAAYIDGVVSRRTEQWLDGLGLEADVEAERTVFSDETAVYRDEARSIALGPAVYGDMHTTDCFTRMENIEEAQQALHELLQADLDEVPEKRGYEPVQRYALRGSQVVDELRHASEEFSLREVARGAWDAWKEARARDDEEGDWVDEVEAEMETVIPADAVAGELGWIEERGED